MTPWMLFSGLSLAFAAPVEAERDLKYLTYSPGAGGVADATFSAWWPGAKLAVATHEANLRERPSTDAPVVAVLDLAEQVEVLEIQPTPTVAIERRNVWIRVRADEHVGWMFGATLSPLATTVRTWEGEHPAVVSFSPDFRPRVRLLVGKKEVVLDLVSSDRVGGRLSARAEAWGPITQLGVTWCDTAGNACERLAVRAVGKRWVQAGTEPWPLEARRDPVAEVFPIKPTEPQRVLTAIHRLTVLSQDGGDDPFETRLDIPCDVIGYAAGGSVVSCAGTPWDVGQSLTRFIARDDGWWYAPNASLSGIEELVDDLEAQNVTIAGVDPTVALPPPYLPAAALVDDARGKAAFAMANASWYTNGEPLAVDPVAGPIFSGGCNTVKVQAGGSSSDTQTTFEYRWVPKTTRLTGANREVCVHSCESWRMQSFNPAGAQPVDSLGAAPVYRTASGLVALDSWDRPFRLLDPRDCPQR